MSFESDFVPPERITTDVGKALDGKPAPSSAIIAAVIVKSEGGASSSSGSEVPGAAAGAPDAQTGKTAAMSRWRQFSMDSSVPG